MQRITLNGEWSLHGRHLANLDMPEINIKATVPGCVQLDMSDAGILPADLFMGENITETEKYEDCEWWYERSFTAPEDTSNAYLVFRGVDWTPTMPRTLTTPSPSVPSETTCGK